MPPLREKREPTTSPLAGAFHSDILGGSLEGGQGHAGQRAPRTATVRAAEAVQLVVVDRAAFLDSIGAHPRCTHTANAVADARLLTVVEAAGG